VLVIGRAWPQKGRKTELAGTDSASSIILERRGRKNQRRSGTRPCQKQGRENTKGVREGERKFSACARRAQPGTAHEAGLCRKRSSFATVSLDELHAAMG
jgi:hypothetical protein